MLSVQALPCGNMGVCACVCVCVCVSLCPAIGTVVFCLMYYAVNSDQHHSSYPHPCVGYWMLKERMTECVCVCVCARVHVCGFRCTVCGYTFD